VAEKLRVLVIDDEAGIRRTLADFLLDLGHLVREAPSADAALAGTDALWADLALVDIRMPGTDGLGFLAAAATRFPNLAVIMVSGHGTLDTAVQAMRLGALDFLPKPVHLTELEAAMGRCRALPTWRGQRRQQAMPAPVLIGVDPALQQVRDEIQSAATAGLRTLLVTGETGTGKELAAASFHRARRGGAGPFVAVNCPALPEQLVESELFGHRRGSFTGAQDDRQGAFQRAEGGTLFLDEVADLALPAQAKLLRVLETWRVQQVGGDAERAVDVAVVAAINRDPAELVAAGRLRADLWHRLNTVTVRLPALRERRGDIPDLARYFAERLPSELGQASWELEPGVVDRLVAHDWPGNIRELRATMMRAGICAAGAPIGPGHIRFAGGDRSMAIAPGAAPTPVPAVVDEASITRAALVACAWNRAAAARQLGISYETLRWRIRSHGLRPG
jgi:DNA-binding NtrC family response regulator